MEYFKVTPWIFESNISFRLHSIDQSKTWWTVEYGRSYYIAEVQIHRNLQVPRSNNNHPDTRWVSVSSAASIHRVVPWESSSKLSSPMDWLQKVALFVKVMKIGFIAMKKNRSAEDWNFLNCWNLLKISKNICHFFQKTSDRCSILFTLTNFYFSEKSI